MDAGNTVTVEVVDLIAVLEAELARRGRIAVLKLDIEGMELPILEALKRRGLFERIDLTLAELHPLRLPDRAAAMEALRLRLAERYAETQVNLDWG